MSAKPNATVVGLFVLGAIAFAVTALIFLGQTAFNRAQFAFVTYFDESISGLELGAAVKFRGVKIGQVTDLKIFLAETDGEGVSSRIPVIYEVDKTNLEESLGDLIDLSKPDEIRRYIDDGLRARLATASLITGLMYIELDIVDPVQYPAEYYSQFTDLYEVPTFKGPLAEISDNLTSVIERVNTVDLETISLRLIELLGILAREAKQAEVGQLSKSLQTAADSVTELAKSPDIPRLLDGLEGTILEYRSLATELKTTFGSTASEMTVALQQLTQTLERLEEATTSLHVMVRPQSSVRTNLNESLNNFSEAAESLRSLADYLERNPSALISGRKPSKD